jgi:tetratricopeptide (TPR) repeat protein
MTHTQLSWLDISDEIKDLLSLAAQHWEDTQKSEFYIDRALEKADGNPDVAIAAYRYFFYKNNYLSAVAIAQQVIESLRQSERLPDNWDQLKPILSQRQTEPQIRLFLSAYSALGLVLARLGKLEEATQIAANLKEIDDRHEFSAGVIFNILTHPEDEDEDE